jgi:signal transduction histidine kinase
MSVNKSFREARLALPLAAGLLMGGFLIFSIWHSYLLFHSLAEIFSVVIAGGVFMIAWNSRERPDSETLLNLGIGFLFAAIIDIFHTLAYQGMGVFPPGADLATQLWVAARYLQALAILLFAVCITWRVRLPYPLLTAVFAILTVLLLGSILYWNFFPVCFVDGQGVTTFKKVSEYAVSAAFALALALLIRRRSRFDPSAYRRLAWALVFLIVSEISFTLYLSTTGLANLIGHLFKVLAYSLVYSTLIAEQVRKRIQEIKQLEQAQSALQEREKALRDANAAKDKFFSIIAHDMRNPLAGLHTVSELLDSRYDSLDEAERRRFSHLLHEGTGQAVDLMQSLLSWARSQTGRLEIKPKRLTLHSLVVENIALVQQAAAQKQIAIAAPIPPHVEVLADPEMASTILRNLLSNAVKFTPRGGSLEVSALEDGSEVQVAVADTGVGMSAQELQKLFRIDEHLASKGTEQEPGNGLGLLVCKEFVEKLGGRIWAESRPGLGSTFRFTLRKA